MPTKANLRDVFEEITLQITEKGIKQFQAILEDPSAQQARSGLCLMKAFS
jgi:hypothetical protein